MEPPGLAVVPPAPAAAVGAGIADAEGPAVITLGAAVNEATVGFSVEGIVILTLTDGAAVLSV